MLGQATVDWSYEAMPLPNLCPSYSPTFNIPFTVATAPPAVAAYVSAYPSTRAVLRRPDGCQLGRRAMINAVGEVHTGAYGYLDCFVPLAVVIAARTSPKLLNSGVWERKYRFLDSLPSDPAWCN